MEAKSSPQDSNGSLRDRAEYFAGEIITRIFRVVGEELFSAGGGKTFVAAAAPADINA